MKHNGDVILNLIQGFSIEDVLIGLSLLSKQATKTEILILFQLLAEPQSSSFSGNGDGRFTVGSNLKVLWDESCYIKMKPGLYILVAGRYMTPCFRRYNKKLKHI